MIENFGPGREATRSSAGVFPFRYLSGCGRVARAAAAGSAVSGLAWALFLGLALLVGCGGATDSGGEPPEPVSDPFACDGCSVLLISVDTLRADRLGSYGNPRQPSPNIDRLADEGALFERAYAASYHTADSHMSMFTSLYPSVHLVRNASGRTGRRLDEGLVTLTQELARAGYATAGFHGGGNVLPLYGFGRGFDLYDLAEGVDPALEWLSGRPAERPFFLFFHTYHVHDPYTPDPELAESYDPGYRGKIVSDEKRLAELAGDGGFRERRDAFWSPVDPEDPADLAHLLALYDAEIHEVDREIGRLLAAVEALDPPVLVILTSDHGEAFYEHGRFLHNDLYDEVLRVPLIMRHPERRERRRVASPVSLIDLAPTVLDIVGLEAPEQFQGRSLLPVLSGDRVPEAVLSEKVKRPPTSLEPAARRYSHYAVVRGDLKLLVHPRPELYDLAADPGESEDLSADRELLRPIATYGRDLFHDNDELRRSLGVSAGGDGETLDREARDQLKALGYLQ